MEITTIGPATLGKLTYTRLGAKHTFATRQFTIDIEEGVVEEGEVPADLVSVRAPLLGINYRSRLPRTLTASVLAVDPKGDADEGRRLGAALYPVLRRLHDTAAIQAEALASDAPRGENMPSEMGAA